VSTADSVNSRALRRESGTPSDHSGRTFQTMQTSRTAASIRSMRTFSTIRGPPHRPHSRVEVVLPAPLAPEHYPSQDAAYGVYTEVEITETYTPAAFGDSWVTLSNKVPLPRTAGRGRRSSTKSVYSNGGPLPSHHPAVAVSSRAASVGPATRLPSIPAHPDAVAHLQTLEGIPRSSSMPPVPRVPSMYANGQSWTPQSSRQNSGVDMTALEQASRARVDSSARRHRGFPDQPPIEEGTS